MSVLALPAELTQSQATACLRSLVKGLKSGSEPAVVVDATALARFDSSALAVLLELRREALAVGKTFAVQGLSARLQNLAVLYGISDLMPAA
jgi:phospholipid transport system transporter-binding protein